MIHINKTISIGCLCEAYLFGEKFGTRIQGPVDNISGYTFKSVLNVFDNSIFNNILFDNIIECKKNPCYEIQPKDWNDDEYMRCYNNWMSVHIDFTLQKRKEEFKKRINNFNEFSKKLDKNSYYIYSLGEYEESLTDEDFEYTINNLSQNVLNNLIIVYGVRHHTAIDKFKKYFRTIFYNINLGSPYKSVNVEYWSNSIYKLNIISNNEDDYQICNILRPQSSIFISNTRANSFNELININIDHELEYNEHLIYILSEDDFNIENNQLENIINNLNENFKQKIIIISKCKEIPELLNIHFRCIQFNIDIYNENIYKLWNGNNFIK